MLDQFQIALRQIRYVTAANLKARYRKTVVGFLWVILNPLILFGAQCLVFMHVLKLGVANYPLFLASGILPWFFLSQSIDAGSAIFVNTGRILKSFPVHPLVYLVAHLADNLVSFLSAFLVTSLFLLLAQPKAIWALLLLPLPTITLFFGVTGIVWLLAIAQVFFRDTRFIASFGINVGYFLTPIFYPVEFVPQNVRWLMILNPLRILIQPFRVLVYEFSWVQFNHSLFQAACVGGLFFGLAALCWKLKRNAVYFHL